MSNHAYLPGHLRLILSITLVHIIAWFAYYSQIPAGQYPGETTRATLDAAQLLANGGNSITTSHSLYTYLLSILARIFTGSENLTTAARVLNACALMLSAGFTASAAGHYWRRNRTVWLAGLLIGLNPLLVFWAGELTPTLLTTACISFALWRITFWLRRPHPLNSFSIAFSLTLATAFETSLYPFIILWPLLACSYPQRNKIPHLIAALVPALLMCSALILFKLQLQSPILWNFDHFTQGIYASLSSTDNYDEKSFGLYRQLHLILFLNPIHWGGLLALAGIGIHIRLRDGHRWHSVCLAIATLIIFAISCTLNQSGTQARSSLIPLLAILAAGITLFPKIWQHSSRQRRRKIVALGVLLCLFSYSGHWLERHPKSWERDYSYLAEANIQAGHNERAAIWAEKALELNPERDDMQQLLVIAQFNDWATGSRQRTLPIEQTQNYLNAIQTIKGTSTTQTISAIYQYKLHQVESAQAVWQSLSDECALAKLCLYWTGTINSITAADLNAYAGQRYHALLRSAATVNRNALEYTNIEKQLDNMLGFAY
ncbi:hypothetical protein QEH59_09215 [Coraliomargarita sp. SDUM461004]|uniref:Glycosyltransferase RgtA/B/C/D-like domain-containing protein n=1 Tax=Thalassobacterium sedimentorum TaxID=3041258 RepID=A0ABU1AIG5_9BACT|nr:hypothetical protein [Coraliomargarita sp. SDUM461004]MDQ8194604.1 hypothetical protein [Coraliomargarita sp. SDUM461004]